MSKFRIKETYLLLMIVVGLVSLSVYTTYAMFTASTTLSNVVNFDTSLSLNTNLSEYELITLTSNETQVIEVNVTNSYDSTLCYGIWYEVVSGDSSSLDIGTFTEKNTTLPSGQITSGSTVTAVVGMSNGSSSSITLKLGTIGRETSGSSCSLGITSPRSLIGTEWADVILVTDEYLSEHTTTASEDYSWSSSTSGSTTLTLQPGTYKLEVWGAEGGKAYDYTLSSGGGAGGKGGYSYGTLTLSETTTIYAYVGGQGTAGNSTTSVKSGGFNGGGNSGYYYGGAGGGASDIRIGTDSLYTRVIVAGGGGGGANYNSTYIGGAGGGTSGVEAPGYDATYTAKGGSSTSGGTAGGYSGYTGSAGSFGKGGAASTASSSYNRSGGGGGGWYGGGGGGYRAVTLVYYQWMSGGGGGSGYVYTSSTASDYPSGGLLSSKYYLTNAATIEGNRSFFDFDGEEVTGHSGDGAIKISGTKSTTYSIPTLSGLTNLNISLGQTANFTKNVEVVCEDGTTGCSIADYPTLDTSTLDEGTYTVYYVVKGSDNKKYKYARTVNVINCTQLSRINFSYTGEVQTYTLTCPGEYKLEVWGAQGGSYSSTVNASYSGGKGGYSYGTLDVTDETTLYVYVGGEGSSGTGGFNGGGTGGSGSRSNSTGGRNGYGGGGATDIRIGIDSLYARVIVAGGGGGATDGYDGGAGGGSSAIDGSGWTGGYDGKAGTGATTKLGGSGGTIFTSDKDSSDMQSYIISSSGGAGGGGGWYGGGGGGGASADRSGYNGTVGTAGIFGNGGTGGEAHQGNYYSGGYSGGGGGGGSGYVYTSETAIDFPSSFLNSNNYLTNAATIAGDQSFTDYSSITVTGHSGNGYARITYLG